MKSTVFRRISCNPIGFYLKQQDFMKSRGRFHKYMKAGLFYKRAGAFYIKAGGF